MFNFVLDAFAGVMLAIVFMVCAEDFWNQRPILSKPGQIVSTGIWLMLIAAAIYRAGTHW